MRPPLQNHWEIFADLKSGRNRVRIRSDNSAQTTNPSLQNQRFFNAVALRVCKRVCRSGLPSLDAASHFGVRLAGRSGNPIIQVIDRHARYRSCSVSGSERRPNAPPTERTLSVPQLAGSGRAASKDLRANIRRSRFTKFANEASKLSLPYSIRPATRMRRMILPAFPGSGRSPIRTRRLHPHVPRSIPWRWNRQTRRSDRRGAPRAPRPRPKSLARPDRSRD